MKINCRPGSVKVFFNGQEIVGIVDSVEYDIDTSMTKDQRDEAFQRFEDQRLKNEARLKELGFDNIYCGFGCPPGWAGLVFDLIDRLIAMGWDKSLHQVKEKFGGLRFYIGEGTEEMYKAINEAEELSYTICQDCGAPGSLRNDRYWILTLCDEHALVKL